MRARSLRTEQYWCPIKHARRVIGAHVQYAEFDDYGDAEAYRKRRQQDRRTLSEKEER
jgi:hypothetical protein